MSTISSGTTLTTALVQTGDTTGDLVIKTGSSNTTAMTISGANQSVVINGSLTANVNVTTLTGVVKIANGGTNATTASDARTNLGLAIGTDVLAPTGTGTGLTALNAANLTSGTVSTARLGSGTANTTTFLRGDNSWQPVQAFSTGTVMLFRQTSAPSGWTKDTTNFNDSALRVVTGTVSSGGTQGFTTAFASQTPAGSVSINTSGLSAGATTLTTAQMPSHKHDLNKYYRANIFYPVDYGSIANGETTSAVNSDAIANTGGGGSHSHSISGSATGTFTGTAINLAVKYCDVIFATKD